MTGKWVDGSDDLADEWAVWVAEYTIWRYEKMEQGEPPRPPKEPKMIYEEDGMLVIGMQDNTAIRFIFPNE